MEEDTNVCIPTLVWIFTHLYNCILVRPVFKMNHHHTSTEPFECFADIKPPTEGGWNITLWYAITFKNVKNIITIMYTFKIWTISLCSIAFTKDLHIRNVDSKYIFFLFLHAFLEEKSIHYYTKSEHYNTTWVEGNCVRSRQPFQIWFSLLSWVCCEDQVLLVMLGFRMGYLNKENSGVSHPTD